jgi:hypothetical protein
MVSIKFISNRKIWENYIVLFFSPNIVGGCVFEETAMKHVSAKFVPLLGMFKTYQTHFKCFSL